MPAESRPATAALLRAEGLGFDRPGVPLLNGLGFAIHPGLTLVRGGDGRGKTTLLGLLAGTLQPSRGAIHRLAAPVYFGHPADPAHDATVARAWLARQQAHHARWQAPQAQAVAQALGLAEHLDKPMHMLSTGSRRKLGLVAAAACGAPLTLLDTPYAALDGASGRVLSQLLQAAAADRERAWVLADGALPPGLAGVTLAACIDLGD